MATLETRFRSLATQGARTWWEKFFLMVLAPLGQGYGAIMKLRRGMYESGILSSFCAPGPVISVGNLTMGGTGKTPVVDYLVGKYLAEGRRVAVVSRGYGGSWCSGVLVVGNGQGPQVEPAVCGDEAYLISRRNPTAIVLVAPRRREGVAQAFERFSVDLVILDDGFQHLAVHRDLDILLLDSSRPFGNGHVFPAGYLREPISALSRGDLFLLTRWRDGGELSAKIPPPQVRCRYRLKERLKDEDGREWIAEELVGKAVTAFAGIADPESFFGSLTELGIRVSKKLTFPDHAPYNPKQVCILREAAATSDFLVTTEKDSVKLRGSQFNCPCLAASLEVEFIDLAPLNDALKSI